MKDVTKERFEEFAASNEDETRSREGRSHFELEDSVWTDVRIEKVVGINEEGRKIWTLVGLAYTDTATGETTYHEEDMDFTNASPELAASIARYNELKKEIA